MSRRNRNWRWMIERRRMRSFWWENEEWIWKIDEVFNDNYLEGSGSICLRKALSLSAQSEKERIPFANILFHLFFYYRLQISFLSEKKWGRDRSEWTFRERDVVHSKLRLLIISLYASCSWKFKAQIKLVHNNRHAHMHVCCETNSPRFLMYSK